MAHHHFCNFIKKGDLRACEIPGAANTLCGVHAPIRARLPARVAGTCEFVMGTGPTEHWCIGQVVAGDRLCQLHVARREREDRLRAARHAAEQAAHRARVELVRQQRAEDEARIAEIMAPRWVALVPPVPAPPRAPVGEIQRIADDRQNVHTATVVKQTNAGEDKLLAVKTNGKPVGLAILRDFAARRGSMRGFMLVANDVEQWYSTKTCRRVGDHLYQRLLEGLWTLIEQQPAPERAELKTRLWEEATESVGMCCEGHIARLVNVMSGFDETFKPRVSVGEAIQAKMAKIAGSEALTTAEKVAEAGAFLTIVGLTAEEQAPWLEALA